MNTLYVVKIGGNIIDDEMKLTQFLESFASIREKKVLVHGGGKLATKLGAQLGIPQQLVDGRRITDTETLKVVTMVYAGLINKNIVAKLQSLQCNAMGICGADGNAILAHKRIKGEVDYGYAGDIDQVNANFFHHLLEQETDIVVAPITHDGKGQLLNTNADTIAQEIATSLSSKYEVSLVFGFEKAGVLRDAENDDTIISNINEDDYAKLRKENVIFAGMIPKLDNAFQAVKKGVKKVLIGRAEQIIQLIEGKTGTEIS